MSNKFASEQHQQENKERTRKLERKETEKLEEILGIKGEKEEGQKGVDKPKQPMLGKKKMVGRRAGLLSSNQTYKPSDFFSRENYINKQVEKIPTSNDNMIVVPPIYDGWGYIVDFYNEEFCSPLTEDQYKSAIRRLNRCIQSIRCKRRSNEIKNFTFLHNIMLILGLAILIIGFSVCEYAVLKEKSEKYYFYGAAGCFLIVGLLSIGLFLSIFVFQEDESISEVEIHKNLSKEIESINNTGFRQAGFEWKIPTKFYWLELHRIRKTQGENNQNTQSLEVSQNQK